MPDGNEFIIDLTGVTEMTGELRLSCVQLVRKQYDAREASKAAEEIDRAEARRDASKQGDTDAGESGGGSGSEEEAVPDSEEGLEEVIKTQISVIRRRIKKQETNIKVLTESLDHVTKLLDKR